MAFVFVFVICTVTFLRLPQVDFTLSYTDDLSIETVGAQRGVISQS